MMKIPADKRVRQYELTYLTSPSLTSDETSALQSGVADLVKKHKGSVISDEEWGKKPLAYTLKLEGKTYTEAVYRHVVVEFETKQVAGFDRDLQLNMQILRHLLVLVEAPKAAKKAARRAVKTSKSTDEVAADAGEDTNEVA